MNQKYFLGAGKLSLNSNYINLEINYDLIKSLTPDEKGKIYVTVGKIVGSDSENTHYLGLDKLKQQPREDAIRRINGILEAESRPED